MENRLKRLAVYCGAAMGTDPAHADLARRLGVRMAERGVALVYGGGHRGLMGVVADAVMGAGGEAYGVIPQALVDLEVAHTGLTELHVVTTMHERKAMMTELTDAFVAIPGGIGTLDELFEAWSWNALGYHAKPFAVLAEDGFWDEMLAFLDTAARAGFVSAARREQLLVAASPDQAIDVLAGAIGAREQDDIVTSVSLKALDAELAQALGRSFEDYGFAIVADHGIPAELIARAEDKARAFFALPDEVKRGYFIAGGGGARGYTPFGIEAAKGASERDLKEFWHVGRELPAGHHFRSVVADNVWPDEVPGFRETFLELYDSFDAAGARLLRAIAIHLGLKPDWFDPTIADGNSVLRLLHYPPVTEGAAGVRAGAHEDINTITLLLGAQEAGLELLDRNGEWLPVKPGEGELVANVGDMLQRLTNNVLRSTSHRVVNPPQERRGVSRYSMPFFLHFHPDFVIETLPKCVSEERPDLYPEPLSSHEFLLQRLREIKLT